MHDLHSTHNPYGDEPTIMEDVKITMTYVPVIKAENIENNHDQKEENRKEQHPHNNNNNEKEDVIEDGQKKEHKTANMTQKQNKPEILYGTVGRSTIYFQKPCHCHCHQRAQ